MRQDLELIKCVTIDSLIRLTKAKLTFDEDIMEERYGLMLLYSTTLYLCTTIRQ